MKTSEIIDKVMGQSAKYRITHRSSLVAPKVGHWRFEWRNGTQWFGHGISSMTAKAALKHGEWKSEELGEIDKFTAHTFKGPGKDPHTNPFTAARCSNLIEHKIGVMAEHLAAAFADECGITGYLVLEFALERALGLKIKYEDPATGKPCQMDASANYQAACAETDRLTEVLKNF